jgi:hypothetical protein
VLIAGARVAAMQKNPTSVPVCVPQTPVRLIVLPKHGRAMAWQLPAPGWTPSQSPSPLPGSQLRAGSPEQAPNVGSSQKPLDGQVPMGAGAMQAFGRFWSGQKQVVPNWVAVHATLAVVVTVPVVSGVMSIGSSPTLLALGRQSFEVGPKTGLMPPVSHTAPLVLPLSHVPPFTPSFGVGSPTQLGQGFSRICESVTSEVNWTDDSPQPVLQL